MIKCLRATPESQGARQELSEEAAPPELVVRRGEDGAASEQPSLNGDTSTNLETHTKFWRIKLQGSSTTVTFGKLGTRGRELRKEHPFRAYARAYYRSKVEEKRRKGYWHGYWGTISGDDQRE